MLAIGFRRNARVLALATAFAVVAVGQGIITTVAGTDAVFSGNGIPARLARLSGSLGFAVAAGPNGVLYVADGGNHAIFAITPDGVLTTIAGNGIPAFSGDNGPATAASLLGPEGVAVSPNGDIYVADSGNNSIRKITSRGIITTVAGNGTQRFSGDGGLATAAGISFPETVAVDGIGNIYVGSVSDSRVRKISPDGLIRTVAGNGKEDYSGDGGPATAAALNYPEGLAVDKAGNLYIADTLNYRIRRVTPEGVISTVVGGGESLSLEKTPAAAAFIIPVSIAIDPDGDLVFGDLISRRVARLTSDGYIVTVAGNGTNATAGDGGPARLASLTKPAGIAIDASRAILIADPSVSSIRKVSLDGNIDRIAGGGPPQYSGDNGPAALASFYVPQAIAIGSGGSLYVADSLNRRVRAIQPDGVVVTVAGTGREGSSGDGALATSADLSFPAGVAVDRTGSVYISDAVAGVVRKMTPDGVISRFAGDGLGKFSGDNGQAATASLSEPTAVKLDQQGNVYIADAANNRIRKVDLAGTITTVAGGGATLGDGCPATSAALRLKDGSSYGGGIALDSSGNLYIADTYNHRIRKVSSAGFITTIAGTGKPGFSGDGGPAIAAQLNGPLGLTLDAAGNLLIADQQNNRIRMISGGTITTVAGNGRRNFTGDGGLATDAALRGPSDVAVDSTGNIYIADQYNNRIRVVLATPPSFNVPISGLRFSAAAGGAPAPAQFVMATSPIPGILFSVNASLSSGRDWLKLTPTSGAAPRLIEIVADPANLAPGEYQATVTVNTPNAAPQTHTIPVTFVVTTGPPPALSTDKRSVSFTFPRTASAQTSLLTVSNAGGGTLNFTAVADTSTGGGWLKATPAVGSATPASPAVVALTANPAGLPPGTYSGRLVIAGNSGENRFVTVTMTVSDVEKALALSQTGLSFTAVANGGIVPPRAFSVLSSGNGDIGWSASTLTLSGTPNWLFVSPSSGISYKNEPTLPVQVHVDPSGLAAGTYYGLVRVDYVPLQSGERAANSPQMLTVALQVLPAGADPGPIVQPAEITFTGVEGGDLPGAREIEIYNISGTPQTFHSVISGGSDNFSISAPPRDGRVLTGQPTRVIVQPRIDNPTIDGDRGALRLAPGVHSRDLTFQFSDGEVRTVVVKLIVAPAGASTLRAGKDFRKWVTGCSPTELLLSVISFGQAFEVPAGWPVSLVVEINDDCGRPLDSGFVSVTFSNGDSPMLLKSLKQGLWEGTWTPQKGSKSQVILTVDANNPDLGLRGKQVLTGGLQSGQDPPITDRNTVVSAASLQPTPVAPGAMISIFGEHLAEAALRSENAPLGTTLGKTTVIMAGMPLPLLYVSPTQVTAVVPNGLNVNTSQQLLIMRGATISYPVSVDVAAAQPAVFLSDTQITARAGEVVAFYASGLGLTDPSVPDGGAAPPDPPARTREALRVTIGGLDAPVQFAGLTGGLVAVYQVSVTVPTGIAPGSHPMVLTIAGQSSPPVSVSIR